MPTTRRALLMLGSDSDFKYCLEGFEYLSKLQDGNKMEIVAVEVASIHRHPLRVWTILSQYIGKIDVIITGAGMANHLSGMVDSLLRNLFADTQINVIGVAFEGKTDEATAVTVGSITDVPGTHVVYEDEEGPFVGQDGFLRACIKAIGELPVIEYGPRKKSASMNLGDAISLAKKKIEAAAQKK